MVNQLWSCSKEDFRNHSFDDQADNRIFKASRSTDLPHLYVNELWVFEVTSYDVMSYYCVMYAYTTGLWYFSFISFHLSFSKSPQSKWANKSIP